MSLSEGTASPDVAIALNSERAAIAAEASTTACSVKSGTLARDWVMRRATICWAGESSTSVTTPLAASEAGADIGEAGIGGCGEGRPDGWSAIASRAARTSALLIRPWEPDPRTCDNSIPSSRATRRASGDALIASAVCVAGERHVCVLAGPRCGAASDDSPAVARALSASVGSTASSGCTALRSSPVSSRAIGAPTGIAVPSAARICSVPEVGDS